MRLMVEMSEYHHRFHQILGYVTTIKSVASVILEDYNQQLPAEVKDLLGKMEEQISQLVIELQELRAMIYKDN